MQVTDEMVSRFIGWPLPKTFAPDCGISFDGRKDDEWNKNKTWPIGTNLLTAIEARAMLEHVLADEVHLLQAALADLYAQIKAFVATEGEADFYTGAALAVLAKTSPLEYHWPFHSPTAEDAIAKLLARQETP